MVKKDVQLYFTFWQKSCWIFIIKFAEIKNACPHGFLYIYWIYGSINLCYSQLKVLSMRLFVFLVINCTAMTVLHTKRNTSKQSICHSNTWRLTWNIWFIFMLLKNKSISITPNAMLFLNITAKTERRNPILPWTIAMLLLWSSNMSTQF